MHKNRRLFDLATRNAQRQKFEEFIASHPQFSGLFALAQPLFHPELSVLLGPTVHRALGILDNKLPNSIGVVTLKTSSVEKALSNLANWTSNLPAGRYIAVFGESSGIRFDGDSYWVPQMPGLHLTLPEQQQQLLELAALSNATCIVSGLDGDAALFSEASSGWLPDEPSPSETVFDLVCWGLVA